MRHEERASKMKHWTQDALMSAALGELVPARDAELCTHIAECVVCRGALRSARAACAAVSAGLELLVAGAPTSQFEARLRARLAAEPEPSRALFAWMHWAPVAVGAVTVAAVLLFALRVHSPLRPSPNATALVADHIQPGPALQIATSPPSQQSRRSPSRRAHASHAASSADARSSEPEVLVEPGQFAAIAQYSAALASGTIHGDQVIASQQELEKPLEIKFLEIKPTDIAPLESSDSNIVIPTSGDLNRP